MEKGNDLPARLLTLRDTCEILNCSMKTVRRRIKCGKLPIIRDGRLKRVHPDDLQRYIAANRSR